MGQAMVSNNHHDVFLFNFSVAIKSAILIQRWYRRFLARMEMKRRYAWSIFQSIEYSGEQDQLQVNFIQIKCATMKISTLQLRTFIFPGDMAENTEIEEVPEYERIEIPDSYTGPRLSFPLTPVDGNILLKAFKHQQVSQFAIISKLKLIYYQFRCGHTVNINGNGGGILWREGGQG
uniref:Protein phosphatase with EF-hand domain 1 n=1 Tax=Callorhinchus milii TaxID=7868 RepID=A0A4W3I6M3_CALMI